MSPVDLRSDTVTRPTPAMRRRMAEAEVGDDVMREDPTVEALQARVAGLFGKEAALFFPSGTMSNLAAVLAWCDARGSEVVVGDRSHLFLFEQAGACQFGGVSMRTVPNLPDGTMDVERGVRPAVRDWPPDVHEPATRLIAVENTHCSCGGAALPGAFLRDLQALAAGDVDEERKIAERPRIPIHMDGARIWNALLVEGTGYVRDAPRLASYVDSLSVCLSKGLGAPAGSLLVGPRALIERARRIRKALGGGMRQVGVLAAAGMQALDDYEEGEGGRVIADDHRRASELARRFAEAGFEIANPRVDTNVVFVRVPDGSAFCAALEAAGVLASAWAPDLIRLVTHRDVTDAGVEISFRAAASCRPKRNGGPPAAPPAGGTEVSGDPGDHGDPGDPGDPVSTIDAIRALAFARHVERPTDPKFDRKMLWTVYSDGEATLQKAGPDLWGRRSEHVIHMGDFGGRRLPGGAGILPRRLEDDGFEYAILEDGADAETLRSMIISFLDGGKPPPEKK